MPDFPNPFEFDAANSLSEEEVLAYYVDDHNFARLLQSKRNVFLLGERGSGKTMTLRWNTIGVQRRRAEATQQVHPLDLIGVLVPCNTPMTHKQEHELLDGLQASVISEHYLVLAIAFAVVQALRAIPHLTQGANEATLRAELMFVLGVELPAEMPLLNAVEIAVQREMMLTQRRINKIENTGFYDGALTFATLVTPLLTTLQRMPSLAHSHFMLMIDDAQDLNAHQVRALNSWLAYRDRTSFSFKVATTKIGQPSRLTASGGTILEGHDFINLDMEAPFHNDESRFSALAAQIIETRLRRVGIMTRAADFFPIHPDLDAGLERAGLEVRQRARAEHPEWTTKQLGDYVFKQQRSAYFRSRDPRANLPPYSGFTMLVYLSTGVVRNLLEPCWWMYDAALSDLRSAGKDVSLLTHIAPSVQAEQILTRSKAAWDRLVSLDRAILGCSAADAKRVRQLFDQLAVYFRIRLLQHRTEPGAVSFSISQQSESVMQQLRPLLEIAQQAQMLYPREGAAKDAGRRETYYVPNRMLWPIRGLDPHGQNARASIKADDLLRASENVEIPFRLNDDQRALFDDL